MAKWVAIVSGAILALLVFTLIIFPWGMKRAAKSVQEELGIGSLIARVDGAISNMNNLQNPLASIDAAQIQRITGLLEAAGVDLDPVDLNLLKDSIADAVVEKLKASVVASVDPGQQADPNVIVYLDVDPDAEEVAEEEVVVTVAERLAAARAKVDKQLGRGGKNAEEAEKTE